jgi:hypothetical protein
MSSAAYGERVGQLPVGLQVGEVTPTGYGSFATTGAGGGPVKPSEMPALQEVVDRQRDDLAGQASDGALLSRGRADVEA